MAANAERRYADRASSSDVSSPFLALEHSYERLWWQAAYQHPWTVSAYYCWCARYFTGRAWMGSMLAARLPIRTPCWSMIEWSWSANGTPLYMCSQHSTDTRCLAIVVCVRENVVIRSKCMGNLDGSLFHQFWLFSYWKMDNVFILADA